MGSKEFNCQFIITISICAKNADARCEKNLPLTSKELAQMLFFCKKHKEYGRKKSYWRPCGIAQNNSWVNVLLCGRTVTQKMEEINKKSNIEWLKIVPFFMDCYTLMSEVKQVPFVLEWLTDDILRHYRSSVEAIKMAVAIHMRINGWITVT